MLSLKPQGHSQRRGDGDGRYEVWKGRDWKEEPNSQMGVKDCQETTQGAAGRRRQAGCSSVMALIRGIICISCCSQLLGLLRGWERLLIQFQRQRARSQPVPLEVEICASVKNIASFAKRKGGQKIFCKTQLHVIIKPFFSQLYFNFMIKISSN